MKMDSVTNTIRNQLAYSYASSSTDNNANPKKTKKGNYWKEAMAGSAAGCAIVPMMYKFDKAGHIENVPNIKTSKLIIICLSLTAIMVATVAFGHKMGQKIIEDAKNRANTKAQ